METDSVWRAAGTPVYSGLNDLDFCFDSLFHEYDSVLVEWDEENFILYPAELVPLQKLSTPALDKHGIAVAQLLTSIHTLAREALGVNLTDHAHFTLDEARQGMIDCVSSFFEELEEEAETAEKIQTEVGS